MFVTLLGYSFLATATLFTGWFWRLLRRNVLAGSDKGLAYACLLVIWLFMYVIHQLMVMAETYQLTLG